MKTPKTSRKLSFQLQEKDFIQMNILFQQTPMAKEIKRRNIRIFFAIIGIVIIAQFFTEDTNGVKEALYDLLPLFVFFCFFWLLLRFVSKTSWFTKHTMKLSFWRATTRFLLSQQYALIDDALYVSIDKDEYRHQFTNLKYITKDEKVLCLFSDHRSSYILPREIFLSDDDFNACANYVAMKAWLEINGKEYRK